MTDKLSVNMTTDHELLSGLLKTALEEIKSDIARLKQANGINA